MSGKVHSTNYFDALIAPAEDCKATAGLVPKSAESVAGLQYNMLTRAPYSLTGDDLLVAVTAIRRGVPQDEVNALRDEIFSKGQPCMRTSPLVKTHGWAVHYDAEGRMALIGLETPEFQELQNDPTLTQVKGMRNARA